MERRLDPSAFETIAGRGASALAWEVLRRDREYRMAVRALPAHTGADLAADSAFVARWGLHFR